MPTCPRQRRRAGEDARGVSLLSAPRGPCASNHAIRGPIQGGRGEGRCDRHLGLCRIGEIEAVGVRWEWVLLLLSRPVAWASQATTEAPRPPDGKKAHA